MHHYSDKKPEDVKLAKVTGLKKKNTYCGLVLNWNKVDEATAYLIEYATNSSFKNSKKKITTKYQEYQLKNLKKNTKYYVRVRAISGSYYENSLRDYTIRGKWSSKISGYSKTMMPNGVKLTTASKGKVKVTFRDFYGKNQKVAIVYATNKNFKSSKTVYTDWGKAYKTINGLKSGKTYYFKLKSYHYTNNKTTIDSKSTYTSTYSVKVK